MAKSKVQNRSTKNDPVIKEIPMDSGIYRIRSIPTTNELIFICFRNGKLILWNLIEDKVVRETQASGKDCWDVSLGSKGEQFVTSDFKKVLKLWNFDIYLPLYIL